MALTGLAIGHQAGWQSAAVLLLLLLSPVRHHHHHDTYSSYSINARSLVGV
jgi:lipid-binding SYLF domain-containing protein